MNHEVIEVNDISTTIVKRLSVKMLTDTSDVNEIKAEIPYIIDQLKRHGYCKPRTQRDFGIDALYQVVYVNFYTHKRQANYGLPFCIAQWVDKSVAIKPVEIRCDDRVEDILIQYGSFHDSLDEMVKRNEVPKEEYLSKLKAHTNQGLDLALLIQDLHNKFMEEKIDINEFKKQVLLQKDKLNGLENHFIGFPESDDDNIVQLQQLSKSAISSLHNVLVVLENDSYPERNIIYLTKINIEDSIKEFNEYYSVLKQFI
jgi:hypothetical protein